MSKMIDCKTCGNSIATSATICPHCGAKNKKPIYKRVWFWGLIILVGIAVFPTDTPDSSNAAPTQPTMDQPAPAHSLAEDDKSSSNEDTKNNIPGTWTTAQKNVMASAKSHLNYTAFSYEGLIDQLEFEKYSHEDAVWAADNCNADWNEEALEGAMRYIDYKGFSYDGLISQLEFEKFTTEQATYGADNCGADWNAEAVESAMSYIDHSGFSYNGLVDQLEFEGFTSDQATYGTDNCGADWNEEAAEKAKSYLSYSSFSRQELIDQLEFEGFTADQAIYGVQANGY